MIEDTNKWSGLVFVVIGYILIILGLVMFEVGITQIYALNEYENMTGLSSILPPTGIIAYLFFNILGLLALVEGARKNLKGAVQRSWFDNAFNSIIGMITLAVAFIIYPIFFERLESLITLLES